MLARRQTVILLSLPLVGSACARLSPATRQDDELRGRMARPHVEKTATARRGGSDVTLPKEPTSSWPAAVIPACTRPDSAASRQPTDSDCQRIDPRADSLRAPPDTAGKKRP